MKYSSKKIPSFIKCHGGKSRYARQYIPLFPSTKDYPIYCEPFAGGAGVLMNKERSPREVISDVDPCIFGTLVQLRDNGEEVVNYIKKLFYYYSENTFLSAKSIIESWLSSKKQFNAYYAAAYIASNRMSRSGLFKDFAQSDRLRGGQMGDKNAWENFVKYGIELTIERLQGVIIYNDSAFTLFNKRNRISGNHRANMGKIVFFLDPPYLHEKRVAKNAYQYEMTREEHIKLLEILQCMEPIYKVFLCGYMSDLYQEYLPDWTIHQFNRPCDSGQTKVKTRRVEVLWESP